jgi:hypothetical protein
MIEVYLSNRPDRYAKCKECFGLSPDRAVPILTIVELEAESFIDWN